MHSLALLKLPRLPALRWVLATFLALHLSSGLCFDLQGHRGARGLAPENTLAAFDRALALGVTTLELDIALTSDGVPVIAHDPHLPPDMTRDAQGQWLPPPTPLIHQLTLAQVQSYDVGRARPGSATARQFPQQQPSDGEQVPTLAALFARVRALGADHVRFNIETKLNPERPDDTATPEAFVAAILRAVRQAGMQGRVTMQSFDWRTLALVQKQAPGLPTAYLSFRSPKTDTVQSPLWTAGLRRADYPSVPDMVKAAGGTLWSPNFASLNTSALAQAHTLGLKVIPWTVNETADMQRLLDWGVDGIITDYPDRLRQVMAQRKMALPAPISGAAR